MKETLEFVIRHGYKILFASVFLEQAGLPVASVPVLLGVGALSADGRFSFAAALLVALSASLPSDAAWFARPRRVIEKPSSQPPKCICSASRSQRAPRIRPRAWRKRTRA